MQHLCISQMYDGARGTYRPLLSGHGGGRDASKNNQATTDAHATQHPNNQSFERGEHWLWCFIDDVAMELGP
jgi:hypothetical protein